MASDRDDETSVPRGDFPFPLTDGAQEKRYLTWLRNHSSYMAVRGLLDYLRLAAVMLRGTLLNALIAVPLLFATAILLGFALLYDPGWWDLTGIVLRLGLVVLLATPLVALGLRVYNYRKSQQTGTESSVRFRDLTERAFGILLIIIIGTIAFEGILYLLPDFHDEIVDQEFGPKAGLTITALVAGYLVADRLLARLGGVPKQIAIGLIGLIGIFIPLVVVMLLADYLVYGGLPAADLAAVWTDRAGWIPIGIALLVLVGLLRRTFSSAEGVVAGLIVVLAFSGASWLRRVEDHYGARVAQVESDIGEMIYQLAQDPRLEGDLEELANDVATSPGMDASRLFDWVDDYWANPDLAGDTLAASQRQFKTKGALGHELRFFYLQASTLGDPQLLRLAEVVDSANYPPGRKESACTELFVTERGLVDGLLARRPALSKTDSVRAELCLLNARLARWQRFIAPRPTTHAEIVHRLLVFAGHIDDGLDDYVLGSLSDPFSHLSAHGDPRALNTALDGAAEHFVLAQRELVLRGVLSPSRYDAIAMNVPNEPLRESFWAKAILVGLIGLVVMVFCWILVDVNFTSMHGFYRDRLATAFLVGIDNRGDVDIEEDLDLGDLARHEAGSTAPYHLINVALNLQGSDDIDLRDRRSDFFIFSKRFIGGRRTGYCRSEFMERVYPNMSLSTAMAISAAATSPNMGRATSPALVLLMTLLNVRLGVWLPNPGRLQDAIVPRERPKGSTSPRGLSFEEIFQEERTEVANRWKALPGGSKRKLSDSPAPTVKNGLVGLAFSGGGIRSATLNLGISQVLHHHGIFAHADYLSTVSGGGYIGSSISAIMRRREPTEALVAGHVSLSRGAAGEKIVTVTPDAGTLLTASVGDALSRMSGKVTTRAVPQVHVFADFANIAVHEGQAVKPGDRLLRAGPESEEGPGSFGELFVWRVPPRALVKETLSWLDEKWRWVNVSDGGHIENLATFELLRRRCKFIIIGDGEADPNHNFSGLATLIRTARIDLGVHIDIDVDALRLGDQRMSREHWAAGQITYPGESEPGWILYMKSSVTGLEDEVIREYRSNHPAFPHDPTADQMFTEGQFEAYRSLGQYIADSALKKFPGGAPDAAAYEQLEKWFETLHDASKRA
jgi:hypothetical protein